MAEYGFRCRWLARLTRGRIGLGRWTQAEIDAINLRAALRAGRLNSVIDSEAGDPR